MVNRIRRGKKCIIHSWDYIRLNRSRVATGNSFNQVSLTARKTYSARLME